MEDMGNLMSPAAVGSITDGGEAPIPEGGEGSQVAEGLVSGKTGICTKVLMGRLEKLIAERKVS
jgi:hypothetical protein